jgi:hypothetical protein
MGRNKIKKATVSIYFNGCFEINQYSCFSVPVYYYCCSGVEHIRDNVLGEI